MLNRRDLMTFGGASIFLSLLGSSLNTLKKSEGKNNLNFINKNDQQNYIQINLYGGPSRWVFDSLLTPYDNDFFPTPMVGTQFSDDLGNMSYKTKKISGINFPSLWSDKISGQRGPIGFENLIDNTIFIRGVDTKASGHPQASTKTVRPNSAGDSLHGIISDNSSSPLSSIIMGSNPVTRSFQSQKRGAVQVDIGQRKMFEGIFRNFHVKTDNPNKLINEALKILNVNKGKNSQYVKSLTESSELLFDDFERFNSEYLHLLKKYEQLVKMTLHDLNIPGVNDFKLPGLKESDIRKNQNVMDKFGRYKLDYQTMFFGNDLRDNLKNVHLGFIPKQFALMEFMITNGLSNSFLISTPKEMGDLLYNVENRNNFLLSSFDNGSKNKTRDEVININMDTHDTGSIMGLVSTSMFFKGLSSCLSEFISVLKRKELFEKSLIHITSEFERIPEKDLHGSAHNEKSHTSTFLSGKIKSPSVHGNIFIGDKEMGTIGTSAPIKEIKRELNQDDIAETITGLLNIPSPVRRSEKIIKEVNGKWVAQLPKAKNLEGSSVF